MLPPRQPGGAAFNDSQRYFFMTYVFRFSILLVFFALAACSRPSDLGLSLVEQDRSDVVYSDTLSIALSSSDEDLIVTSDRARMPVGAYSDPTFGTHRANAYFNFKLPSTNLDFGDASFDSLVLVMVYDSTGHYGEINLNPSMQEWEVLRLEESILEDESYESDATFATGSLLANLSFTPNLNDSVLIQDNREAPQLRIRLDDALGQELLSPSDSTIYNTNNDFKEFLKGVLLRPVVGSSMNNSILRFLPRHPDTRLCLYYTETVLDDNGVPSQEPRLFEFTMENDVERVLNYEHDYSGTEVLANNPQDSLVYLQGMAGVNVKVEFPYLQATLGQSIINQAILELYPLPPSTDAYPLPNQLVATSRDEEDNLLLIEDFAVAIQPNGAIAFSIPGGTLDTDEQGRDVYRLNISGELQNVLDGELTEPSLYLDVFSAGSNIERVVFGNQRNNQFRARLLLTYTRVE